MLLLMNILRSRYRGVIHFYPADADSPPEIEFSDGEGPEQVMNQIQDFAVPEIRKSIEPLGPYLRWEELDLETGVLRRHRSRFHDRFEFVLCPDELGIILMLPEGPAETGAAVVSDEASASRKTARPWVPLRPLAEPGPEHLAAIGWSVAEPSFKWRYVQTRYAPPTLEMTWSCDTLPTHWASQVLAEAAYLDCHFDEGRRCQMNPTRDGLLVYRGFYPLPEGSGRPASLEMQLHQPLVVVGPEANGSDTGRHHELDEEIPATVEAHDFRAIIDDRPTRLVARADLDRLFEAEVLTPEDVLLPEVIPARAVPGLPWDLEVEAVGRTTSTDSESHPPDRLTAEGTSRQYRWRLVPRRAAHGDFAAENRGRWSDISWEGATPSLAFGLGAFDPSEAPRIMRIENRRASVAWQIEANDEGGSVCLCVPHWVPVGCPGHVALPPRESPGFDYAAEVRASLDGVDERFVIDQRSEVPGNRLFLGPRRWRFRDEHRGAITDAEAFGEGAGCVRWRRSVGERDVGQREIGPTDWAGGSAPVLLLHQQDNDGLQWGGLYAPRKVPWDALEEVPAEPTSDPEEILLVPRAPSQGIGATETPQEQMPAIWIDLWGFICRYDAHSVSFARSRGETSEPTAWIARTGLDLFPRQSGHLLRAFSPIYVVRDPEPRTFRLRPTAPRPTLHLGRELDSGALPSGPQDSLVLEIGNETFVRYQLTKNGRPPERFEPGRVPGTRLRFDRIGRQTVWLALEQRRGREHPHHQRDRGSGYILSWNASEGWLLRGFYAHQDTAVELGMARQGDRQRRVFLGGPGAGRISAFQLTIDQHGDQWSETAPESVTDEITPDTIRAWENDHFAPEHRPGTLRDYGMRILQHATGDLPWIFEFFDGEARAGKDLPLGIRVWELHGEVDDEWIEGARELGEDLDTDEVEIVANISPTPDTEVAGPEPDSEPAPAEPMPDSTPAMSEPASEPEPAPQVLRDDEAAPETAPEPGKRILRADDDDDF